MRSKAALGNHPLHPLLVTLPVGAFFLVLLGDIGSLMTKDPFWYRFSFDCLAVGILSALVAASVGSIDYLTVKMSVPGRRLATIHMILNLSAVVLYIIDWWLRRHGGALGTNLWMPVVVLEIIALCTSSELFGQVGNGTKRGSGPSGLKLRPQFGGAAGVGARWFSA